MTSRRQLFEQFGVTEEQQPNPRSAGWVQTIGKVDFFNCWSDLWEDDAYPAMIPNGHYSEDCWQCDQWRAALTSDHPKFAVIPVPRVSVVTAPGSGAPRGTRNGAKDWQGPFAVEVQVRSDGVYLVKK